MRDVRELLERQARWQKSRAALSWAEKIRMVEAIRDDIVRLRAGAEPKHEAPETSGGQTPS